jgi:hypothetical protein
MKRIRIILLVAFILGLVLFQVKFVTENDNLNIKADISLSQKAKANPEWFNPESSTGTGSFTIHNTTESCGTQTQYTITYKDIYGLVVGVDVYLDGILQDGGYNGYYYTRVFDTTTITKYGVKVTCQGGTNFCVPQVFCP